MIKNFSQTRHEVYYVEYNKKLDDLYRKFIQEYNLVHEHKIKLNESGKIPVHVIDFIQSNMSDKYKEECTVLKQHRDRQIKEHVKSISKFANSLKSSLLNYTRRQLSSIHNASATDTLDNLLSTLSNVASAQAIYLRMQHTYKGSEADKLQFADMCLNEWRHYKFRQEDIQHIYLDSFIVNHSIAFQDVKLICRQLDKILEDRGINKKDSQDKLIFIRNFRREIHSCCTQSELLTICKKALEFKVIPVKLKDQIKPLLSSLEWEEKLKLKAIESMSLHFINNYHNDAQIDLINSFLNRCKTMCLSVFISELMQLQEVERKVNIHPLWRELSINMPDHLAGQIFTRISHALLSATSDIQLVAGKKIKEAFLTAQQIALQRSYHTSSIKLS